LQPLHHGSRNSVLILRKLPSLPWSFMLIGFTLTNLLVPDMLFRLLRTLIAKVRNWVLPVTLPILIDLFGYCYGGLRYLTPRWPLFLY